MSLKVDQLIESWRKEEKLGDYADLTLEALQSSLDLDFSRNELSELHTKLLDLKEKALSSKDASISNLFQLSREIEKIALDSKPLSLSYEITDFMHSWKNAIANNASDSFLSEMADIVSEAYKKLNKNLDISVEFDPQKRVFNVNENL